LEETARLKNDFCEGPCLVEPTKRGTERRRSTRRKKGIVRETSPLLDGLKQLGKVPLKADDGDVEVLHVN
jgi:hypothetical protein